jgi:hypothetical protein
LGKPEEKKTSEKVESDWRIILKYFKRKEV